VDSHILRILTERAQPDAETDEKRGEEKHDGRSFLDEAGRVSLDGTDYRLAFTKRLLGLPQGAHA